MKIPKVGLFLEKLDIINANFGSLNIDKKKVSRFASRFGGSVWLTKGKYYTFTEFENRKKRTLNKKLP